MAPSRDFVSGERLRARFHRVAGEVDVLVTFHDVVLDVDCAYVDDDGGANVGPGAASYCLPSGAARHREGRGPYLDGACTELAATPPTGTAPAYGVVAPRDACSAAPIVRAALAVELRRPYFRDEGGACRPGARAAVQRLGDPVEGLVRAAEVSEPRSGPVDARVLLGSDGSRLVVGGFDRLRGEPVRVGDAGDGFRRWVPSRVAYRGSGELLYADASCAAPAASKIGRTATCPLTAALVLEGTCGAGTYHALGEPVTAAFQHDGAACSPTSSPDALLFTLGRPRAPSTFFSASFADIGGPRARRRAARAEGGDPVSFTDVVDAATGEPCAVTTATDGDLRCLPSGAELVDLHEDADCTLPAFAHPITGCEPPSWTPRFVRSALESPPRAFEVLREVPRAYTLTRTGCAPYAPPVPSRLFAAREIAPSRFPRATLESDP